MDTSHNKIIGDRIKTIRINKGLSMEEFGVLFDPPVTKGTISKWENGKYLPNNNRLKSIAELANIPVETLLTPPLENLIEQYFNELMEFEISQGDQRYKLFYDPNERLVFLNYLTSQNYNHSSLDYGVRYDVKNYTEIYLEKYFELKNYTPYSNRNAKEYSYDSLQKIIKKIDNYFKDENIPDYEIDGYIKDHQIKKDLSPELYSQIRIAFENLSDKLKNI